MSRTQGTVQRLFWRQLVSAADVVCGWCKPNIKVSGDITYQPGHVLTGISGPSVGVAVGGPDRQPSHALAGHQFSHH